ncbi:MAG: ECF transporter S component [Thaumarchaeota archaeon]|nr:ECF transporter S component [Nitrososphaerota archaeon]
MTGDGRPRLRGPYSTRSVASAAIFTAFVTAATAVFTVVIPATSGYFNIGEVMVYTTALLMGPYVGAFAGGLGSAISDAIIVPIYAPGTLIIKGTEGFIAGYLTKLPIAGLSRRKWILLTAAIGLVLSGLVSYLGVNFLSGDQTLYLGLSYCSANCSTTSPAIVPVGPQFSHDFTVPVVFWIAVSVITFFAVLAGGLKLDPRLSWTVFSVLVAGSEMVLGYFLYESLALRLGFVTASSEVPFNIGQVLVGLLVAVPLVRSYRRVSRRSTYPTAAGQS